jgi:hypothetical protein
MRTCPDCQAQLDDRANFCDNCGLQLSPLAEEPASTPDEQGGSLSARRVGASTPTSTAPEASPGTCSACGYVNVVGEMFCQNCGVQLAPVISVPPPPPTPISGPLAVAKTQGAHDQSSARGACSHCGFQNKPGEKFCQNCGIQLVETPAEASEAESSSSEPSPSSRATLPAGQVISQLDEIEEAKADISHGGFVGKIVVKHVQAEIALPGDKSELYIGRADPVRDIHPDIDLVPYGGDVNGVSRLHARLVVKDAQIYIEDLNSTNFTFLNQQRLQPGQLYALKPGDEIRLGLLMLQYLAD